jgi:hypothetical protein
VHENREGAVISKGNFGEAGTYPMIFTGWLCAVRRQGDTVSCATVASSQYEASSEQRIWGDDGGRIKVETPSPRSDVAPLRPARRAGKAPTFGVVNLWPQGLPLSSRIRHDLRGLTPRAGR